MACVCMGLQRCKQAVQAGAASRHGLEPITLPGLASAAPRHEWPQGDHTTVSYGKKKKHQVGMEGPLRSGELWRCMVTKTPTSRVGGVVSSHAQVCRAGLDPSAQVATLLAERERSAVMVHGNLLRLLSQATRQGAEAETMIWLKGKKRLRELLGPQGWRMRCIVAPTRCEGLLSVTARGRLSAAPCLCLLKSQPGGPGGGIWLAA